MLHTLLTATKKLFSYGRGYTTTSSSPTLITGGSDTAWKDIARGTNHSVAVRADGTLWGWGTAKKGSIGNLVDNTVIASTNATQIGTSNTWAKVIAGNDFSVGLKKDGTMWGWGDNTYWQLGGALYASSPYFSSVSSCDLSYQSIGLKTDGTIWVWGNNNWYDTYRTYNNWRLGLETSTSYYTSPQLLNVYKEDGVTLETFKYVFTTMGSFYAITTEGRLYSWGNYGFGSLTVDSNKPGLKDFAWPSSPKSVARTDSDVYVSLENGLLYKWNNSNSTPTLVSAFYSVTTNTQNINKILYSVIIADTSVNSYPYYSASSDAFIKFSSTADRTAFLDAVTQYTYTDNSVAGNGSLRILAYNEYFTVATGKYYKLDLTGATPTTFNQYNPGTNSTDYVVRYTAIPIYNTNPGTSVGIPLGQGQANIATLTTTTENKVSISKVVATYDSVFALSSTGKVFYTGGTPAGYSQGYYTVNAGTYSSQYLTYYNGDTSTGSTPPSVVLADGDITMGSIENVSYVNNGTVNISTLAYGTVTVYNNAITAFKIYAPYPQTHAVAYSTATFIIPNTTVKVKVNLSWTSGSFGPSYSWIDLSPGTVYIDISAGYQGKALALLDQSGGVAYCNNTTSLTRINYDSSKFNVVTTPAYKISLADSGAVSSLKFIGNSLKSIVYAGTGLSATDYSTTLGDIDWIQSGYDYSATFLIGSATSSVTTARSKLYSFGKNNYGVSGIGIDDGTNTSTVRSLTSVGGIELAFTKTPIKLNTKLWKDIAAGESHLLAIDDGNVLWGSGRNNEGQLATTDSAIKPLMLLGADTTKNWASIYAGGNTSAAIDMNGKAFTWGSVKTGAVGLDRIYEQGLSASNTGSPYLTSINEFPFGTWSKLSLAGSSASATSRNLGISSSGNLYNWGYETAHSVNTGSSVLSSNIQFNQFQKLFGCLDVAYGIKTDGTLWAWGINDYGQLGVGSTTSACHYPLKVGTYAWTKLSTNGSTTVAIKSDGTLWAWGRTSSALGLNVNTYEPYQLSTDTNWTDIAVGGESGSPFLLAIKNSQLVVRGSNQYGQLGNNTNSDISSFTTITISGTTVIKIAVGFKHSAIMTASGQVRVAGDNSRGQLGLGITQDYVTSFTKAADYNTHTKNITNVFAGGYNTAYTWDTAKNYLDTAGDNTYYQLHRDAKSAITNFTVFESGIDFVLALDQNNNLFGWGNNDYYQLTAGTTGSKSSPVLIGDKQWTTISVAGRLAAGVDNTGKLWVWGDTSAGNSGLSSNSGNVDMTEIAAGGSLTWKNVKLGTSHGLGIKSDGTLWAWGYNNNGQLGQGNTTNSFTPIQVGTSTNWSTTNVDALAAGYWTSHAINTSNQMFGWGYNTRGAVGNGTTTDVRTPTQIATGSSWRMVKSYPTQNSVGMVAAITNSTNYLYTWGSNTNLKLGSGQSGATNVTSPTRVGTGTWYKVYVGQSHIVAITNGFYLYTWGTESYGELGDGSYSGSISTPSLIDNSTSYLNAGAGYYVSFATDSITNITKVTGDNSNNKLGLGDVATAPTAFGQNGFISQGNQPISLDRSFGSADTSYQDITKVVFGEKYGASINNDSFVGKFITIWGSANTAIDSGTYTDHQPFKYQGLDNKNISGAYGRYPFDTGDIAACNSALVTIGTHFWDLTTNDWNYELYGEIATLGVGGYVSAYQYYDQAYDATKPMKPLYYRNAFVQKKYTQIPTLFEANRQLSTYELYSAAPFKDITTGKTSSYSESLAIGKDDSLYAWGTTALTTNNGKVGLQKWYKLGKGGFAAILRKTF